MRRMLVTSLDEGVLRRAARRTSPTTLTQRASLTAVAAWLDYAARIGVGLVVTPVILGVLGRSLFGVWEVLLRLVSYAAIADGRPMEALRLVIAREQGRGDTAAQRRAVGTALVMWLLFVPIALAVGAVVVWAAPGATGVGEAHTAAVRACAALLVLNLVLTTLVALPEAVLAGVNQGYRRMGLVALAHVVNGALMVAAVRAGYGLAGLAAVQVLVTLLTASLFFRLVRRHVAWFGATRPDGAAMRGFASLSGWSMAGDGVAKVLLASDVVILGVLSSTAIVTSYVLTGYAAQAVASVITLGLGAAVAGLADVFGRAQDGRADALRRELLTLGWIGAAVSGAIVLLWNRSFLDLWVGPGHFAGSTANVLLVLMLVQTVMIRCETTVLNAMLQVRVRVIVSVGALIVACALAALLVPRHGVVGVCVAMLLGRLVQSVGLPVAANRAWGQAACAGWRATVRPVLSMVVVVGACAVLEPRVYAGSWVQWVGGVALTGLLLPPVIVACGVPARDRRALRARIRSVLA